ncbi:MAG: HEAT repeat domain-containing protein [Sandaracinaceae bacterium]
MKRTPRWVVVLLALSCLGFEWEGRLARLSHALDDPDPAVRRDVVQELSSYPAGEVQAVLLRALGDEDPGVRAQAADAVGQVRLRDAIPRLLDWLDDPDADVRAAAARALGRIGERETIPHLTRMLGDASAGVRRAGVEALASIGTDAVIVPLLGRLDDEEPLVRVDAATELGRLADPRAVVPLVGRARDDAPEVRAAVYSALGDLGDGRAVPALIQGLRDSSPDTRLTAIAALGRIGALDAVRPLMSVALGDDGRAARAATAALGQIPGDDAHEALAQTLTRPATRAIATQTIVEHVRRDARHGDGQAGRALVQQLAASLDTATDLSFATQLAATIELAGAYTSTAEAAPALLAALRDGRGEPPVIVRALGTTGSPDALVPLLEWLRREEPAIRAAVLEALLRHFARVPPDGRAADPLLAALGDVRPEERALVVRLIGQVGAARALPDLRALLAHPDTELRLAAVQAIGAIGDPEGASAVAGLLDDRDARLRFEAAHAVGHSASDATVRTLLQRLRDPRPTDRHALLLALTDALPRLAEASTLDGETSALAERALLAAVRSDDEQLAARALDTVAAWHPASLEAPIVAELDRAGPRRSAALANALGSFEGERARAALSALLDEPSVRLQTVAASRIGEHGGPAEAARLLERAPGLAWPASAAAAFSLARMAQRDVLDADTALPPLCALAASHDPFVRANVATALAALRAPACPDGVSPLSWLGRTHAAVVRIGAARWAHAAGEASRIEPAAVRSALAACADEPLLPEVAAACARPGPVERGAIADVFAYETDGTSLLTDRTIALRLADGSVLVGLTDANGHVRLADAPQGPLSLEDPSATPLEP